MRWVIVGVGVLLNATANILIKFSMQARHTPAELLRGLLDLRFVAGVLCFALALAAYAYALSRLDLSIVYPIMTGAGFLLVAAASAGMLSERFSPLRVAGMLVILVGVVLVARSA